MKMLPFLRSTGYQPVSSSADLTNNGGCKKPRHWTRAGSPCYAMALLASLASAQTAPPTQPAGPGFPTTYTDPVPHEIITQPYRVCQDLEELTSRINNLYRKPYAKLFDEHGRPQPEVVYFKDVTSGHEIMSLTRELCIDIAHADLGRPVWTVDGKFITFMGNRAMMTHDGQFRKTEWTGKMYSMNADYSDQRSLIFELLDEKGNVTGKSNGLPGKYTILDPDDSSRAYYAAEDKLYEATFSPDPAKPHQARQIATLATKHQKIIQAISRDRKLLIQDVNADFDRKAGKPLYMPEIHLVDLKKKPGEAGFYDHHPFDYGLPEVKGLDGKVLHDANNNYQFHSLMFVGNNAIGWNYGPMTQVGEFIGYSLDITNGLHGTPRHGEITRDGGGNPFGQYESHGRRLADSSIGLYYSGPATVDGKKVGEYGLYLRDYADNSLPVFITPAPGGHVAGGESFNPNWFAAHIQASSPAWRQRVKESDAIVFGNVADKKAKVLCYTYSDVRGGTKTDRATGKKIWSGMDNNDFRPYYAIPRPLLSRDATKVWFHSSMLMPTEDWTGIYVAVLRRPEAPVSVTLANDELTFKPSPGAVETKCFHIYRKVGDNAPQLVTSVDARSKGKIEDFYTFGQWERADNAAYFVTAEEWSGLESDTTSNLVTSTGQSMPALTKFDTEAPSPVSGFTAVREEAGQYRLQWTGSVSTDLRYYNIYFSQKGQPEITQKRLIASPLKGMTSYLDWSAPIEGGAFYAITAVDRQGNESTPTFVEVK